jgi:hypothetical protein
MQKGPPGPSRADDGIQTRDPHVGQDYRSRPEGSRIVLSRSFYLLNGDTRGGARARDKQDKEREWGAPSNVLGGQRGPGSVPVTHWGRSHPPPLWALAPYFQSFKGSEGYGCH